MLIKSMLILKPRITCNGSNRMCLYLIYLLAAPVFLICKDSINTIKIEFLLRRYRYMIYRKYSLKTVLGLIRLLNSKLATLLTEACTVNTCLYITHACSSFKSKSNENARNPLCIRHHFCGASHCMHYSKYLNFFKYLLTFQSTDICSLWRRGKRIRKTTAYILA